MSRLASARRQLRSGANRLATHTAPRTSGRAVADRRIVRTAASSALLTERRRAALQRRDESRSVRLLLRPLYVVAVRPDQVLVVVGRLERRHDVGRAFGDVVAGAAADR